MTGRDENPAPDGDPVATAFEILDRGTPGPYRVRDGRLIGSGNLCVDAPETRIANGQGRTYARVLLEDEDYPEKFDDAVRAASLPPLVAFAQEIRSLRAALGPVPARALTPIAERLDAAIERLAGNVNRIVAETDVIRPAATETDDFLAQFAARRNAAGSP